jgi:mRNA interferase RelE/StbE
LLNNYKLFETEPFLLDLKKDFEGKQTKIRNKLITYIYPQLKNNPHFGNNIKKLKNYIPETWRYRIGNYRLFYEINESEKIVFLIAIDARGNSY